VESPSLVPPTEVARILAEKGYEDYCSNLQFVCSFEDVISMFNFHMGIQKISRDLLLSVNRETLLVDPDQAITLITHGGVHSVCALSGVAASV